MLESRAVLDGGASAGRNACDGEECSPPLALGEAPPGARSFALLCDETDAPAGAWRRWAIDEIPADRTGLAEDDNRQPPWPTSSKA